MTQGLTYAVDIVICIDATGSMGPVIEEVKRRARRFPDDLLESMKRKDKIVTQLRLKIVAYRDVEFDKEAFLVSDFFNVPAEADALSSFLDKVKADGGGDPPESGLEALALALDSDWTHDGNKLRHLVVVWTDASAHPLEKSVGKLPPQYVGRIPGSFNELTDMWESSAQTSKISRAARRLVLFSPEATPWSEIRDNWDETVHFPSKAGEGLADHEYEEILDTLAQSV